MVRVIQQRRKHRYGLYIKLGMWIAVFGAIGVSLVLVRRLAATQDSAVLAQTQHAPPAHPQSQKLRGDAPQRSITVSDSSATCPYMKLSDLAAAERYPMASAQRHMVDPPGENDDLGVALVCCETTKGPWNIMVHHSWAPIGARRFLDMVESSYFQTRVPLMRCVNNFLCQFGLNGVPERMKVFRSLPDDPNWLPAGPKNRKNKLGVSRFQRGYLAYAGAGPNSRSLQFIVALKDNGPLAGGSPWEVPWGELVGDHSFTTLSQIYTGYGEKGPKQGLLHRANAIQNYVEPKFPDLDYVNSCQVVDTAGGQQVRGSTVSTT